MLVDAELAEGRVRRSLAIDIDRETPRTCRWGRNIAQPYPVAGRRGPTALRPLSGTPDHAPFVAGERRRWTQPRASDRAGQSMSNLS